MDDAVSYALAARTHGSEGLTKMLAVSAAAHVILMMLAALAPGSFWQRPLAARAATVTIDLGPGTSQRTQGLTSIGDTPVQRAVPDLPRTRPVHPPVAKTPDSALPDESPRVKPITPDVNDAPKDARGRMPAAGADVRAGDASAPTGAQSMGVNLSVNDGGAPGRQLNVGDFCCPEYIGTMLHRIRQNWSSGRGTTATTTMTFTIQRDGAITDVRLSRSSGNQMLDFLAERALLAVRQLPPLPDAYPHPSLILDLEFNYQR